MISEIRLVNCQSWEDCSIHLAQDRLNVIEAKNNVGKSVLMKMLKISISPKFFSVKKRKKLIRWGADDARAIYTFTDGAIAAVFVQPTKVIYMFRESNEEKFSTYLEPPARLISELGAMVNSSGSFIANILDTDQALLLVDSDSKATFEFIQLLCNNATVDELLTKLNVIRDDAGVQVTSLRTQLSNLDKELGQLVYVDVYSEEQKLLLLTDVKNALYQLVSGGIKLNKLAKSTTESKNYDYLLEQVGILQKLESMNLGKLQLKEFNAELLGVCKLLSDLESVNLNNLIVKEPTVDSEVLGILEKLESVDLERMVIPNEPDLESVNNLVVIEKAYSALQQFDANWKKQHEAYGLFTEYEHMFKEAGREYECPIYGKVVFDGKSCVSCDY